MRTFTVLTRVLSLAGLITACNSNDSTGPSNVALSGTVRDYFTTAPLSGVQLSGDQFSAIATSSASGAYTLTPVPARTTVTLVGSLANYRPTRSEPVVTASRALVADLSMIANTDVNRQYTATSVTLSGGTAVVFVDLRDDSDQPRAGIPLADITLQDASSTPVGAGPFVFGVSGDLDPALTLTTTFTGRSRVGFLNVPAGTMTLRVTLPGPTTLATTVLTSPGGATLTRR